MKASTSTSGELVDALHDQLLGPLPPADPLHGRRLGLVHPPADDARRRPADDLVGGDVVDHHRTGGDHGAVVDREPAEDEGSTADPDVVADDQVPLAPRLTTPVRVRQAQLAVQRVAGRRVEAVVAARHQIHARRDGGVGADPDPCRITGVVGDARDGRVGATPDRDHTGVDQRGGST